MNVNRQFTGHIVDLIMVTRPVVLIPVWGFSALGFNAALHPGSENGYFPAWQSATLGDYGKILLFSLSVAAVYIVNQLADIETDKKNGGMPLIASGIVSVYESTILLCICSAISLCIPLFIHHTLLSFAALSTIVLGIIYSVKPFRFSGKPISDFVCNAIGYGIIAFGVGWELGGKTPFSGTFLHASLPYFFLMCAGSISSTLPDMKGDREDNKFTTAVVFGKMVAHTIAFTFLLTAGCIGIIDKEPVVMICAGISIPFYIGFYIRNHNFFMEATYKIGGGLCMLAAFIALPLFIPLSLLVFLVTWLYFRIRHGMSYPSLIPNKSQNVQ